MPSWSWGGDPSKLITEAGFRGRLVDKTNGLWEIRTTESYYQRHPDLVKVDHIAGARQKRNRFDLISQFVSAEVLRTGRSEREEVVLESRRLRAERTKAPVDSFALWQLQLLTAVGTEVAEVIEGIHQALLETTFLEEETLVFPHASVHVVRRLQLLVRRVKLIGVFLRIEHDEQLKSGDISAIKQLTDTGDSVFASSAHLHEGVILFDAYLSPLLGALTPAIWSIGAHREAGVVVHSLGQPLVGVEAQAVELLNLLPIQESIETVSTPKLSPLAGQEALDWWATRLNHLFGILTDPTVFVDGQNIYDPSKHLRWILTIEQMFRRVSSIQGTHRDVHARRVLLFSVLDTASRIINLNIEDIVSIDKVRKKLENLRGSMLPAAAKILLPSAERAVVALEKIQDGFFIQRQLGKSTLEYRSKKGDIVEIGLDKAAAEYIKVLRNATHGHGKKFETQGNLENVLLAHHDGSFPHDLGLLGYFYLLDILANPDALRQRLETGR